MDETTQLLQSFGFTARDAHKIAHQVEKNGLSIDDVKAWIDEANNSTSLLNPLGFVRARLQDGDRMAARATVDLHVSDRHRYVTQWEVHNGKPSIHTRTFTQTCTCGRVYWKTSFCADCGLCPACCTCPSTDQDKE